jgi:hypothetical protein
MDQAALDAITTQNAASFKRQADTMEKQAATTAELLALQKRVESGLFNQDQEAFMKLLEMCMTAATRTLTLTSSDITRADATVNAVEMAVAAFPTLRTALAALKTPTTVTVTPGM